MCKAVSILITKSNKGYYKLGVDFHEDLLKLYQEQDLELKDNKEPPKNTFTRVEVSPTKGYFNPKKSNWQFKLDEQIKPEWWMPAHEETAWKCWKSWKKDFYPLVNLKEARHLINPIKIKHSNRVSKKEIELAKTWASVRASVGASVGDSVWDSMWDSVWDSVRASIGSFFKIKNWKYTEKLKIKGYPFQSGLDLWKRGLILTYDGKTWRIHNMSQKAKIIWSGKLN
jgi:hypothetical protein